MQCLGNRNLVTCAKLSSLTVLRMRSTPCVGCPGRFMIVVLRYAGQAGASTEATAGRMERVRVERGFISLWQNAAECSEKLNESSAGPVEFPWYGLERT